MSYVDQIRVFLIFCVQFFFNFLMYFLDPKLKILVCFFVKNFIFPFYLLFVFISFPKRPIETKENFLLIKKRCSSLKCNQFKSILSDKALLQDYFPHVNDFIKKVVKCNEITPKLHQNCTKIRNSTLGSAKFGVHEDLTQM